MNPANYSYFANKEVKEHLLVILASTAAATVMALVIGPTIGSYPRGIWLSVCFAVLLATFCAYAIWLAWGGSRVLWRFLVATLGVGMVCGGVQLSNSGNSGLEIFGPLTLGASIFAGAPRLWGVQRIRLASKDTAATLPQAAQYSIRDLLAWTAVVAILSGLFRLAYRAGYFREEFATYLIWSARLGTCSLAAMWAALATGKRNVARFVIAGLSVAGFNLAANSVDEQVADDGKDFFIALILSWLFISGALYFFRRRGYRLMRYRAKNAAVPQESRDQPLMNDPLQGE